MVTYFGAVLCRQCHLTFEKQKRVPHDKNATERTKTMGLLPRDADILPPSDDRIFKLILTLPDNKLVLTDLISAILGRTVVDVVVRNNELPVCDTKEKEERLDVNCAIDDGSQVDLEMQASYMKEVSRDHANLIGKIIYYLCDLHSSQSSRSKQYESLARTYQVTFCSYTVWPNLPGYVNWFSMRHDVTNELLSNAIRAIVVELSKLSRVITKSVGDMTDLEKWAVFFRYADIPQYRETVNRVIASKEALQMAGNSLITVSQNDRERAKFRSRRMYQSDLDSNFAAAEARGIAIGEAIGEARGEARGIGLGEARKGHEVARNAIAMGMDADSIGRLTGLSRSEVEELRRAIPQT